VLKRTGIGPEFDEPLNEDPTTMAGIPSATSATAERGRTTAAPPPVAQLEPAA